MTSLPATAVNSVPDVNPTVLRAKPTIAPHALGHALLLGLAGDLLLRDGFTGAGFPMWIALLVLGLTSLSTRAHKTVGAEPAAWMAVAVLSACGMAWRNSQMLQLLDFIATAGALGMTAITIRSEGAGLFSHRFRDTVWAGAAALRTMVPGLLPNIAEAMRRATPGNSLGSRGQRSLRLTLLALAVLLVFGSLLRGADPIFASLVTAPDVNLGQVLSHVLLAGWCGWLMSGWSNAALGSPTITARAFDRYPLSLAADDLTASLGVLNVLFCAFMVAQVGWLFGGETFLHARTGLTAAQYARHGFFEMVLVSTLVIPMLVISRGALVDDRAVRRRHSLLAVSLLALLVGMIISAGTRMQLYVHYYGLTVDRLYTLVFMLWLMGVLAWLALTVLRERGRTFVPGAALSGLVVLLALNVAAPDAVVANFNAARMHTSPDHLAPDVYHLSQLSAEAIDVAIPATLATPRNVGDSAAHTDAQRARCSAAYTLVRRWGPTSSVARRAGDDDSWRSWNAGERRAVRLVGANAGALRRVQQSACAGIPFNQRFRATLFVAPDQR